MTTTKAPGPKEVRLREQREARVSDNKRLIDKSTKMKAKGIGKVASVKLTKRGRR